MTDALALFVDDERPAPEGWILAPTAAQAIDIMQSFRTMDTEFDAISLDYDLGTAGGNTEELLVWMRTHKWWPTELYVHTANEDAEELLLEMIKQWAPEGVLRGYGCNFWGTGPDSVVQNHLKPPLGAYPFDESGNLTVAPLSVGTQTLQKTAKVAAASELAGVNDLAAPIPNDLPSAHDLVIADMQQRKQLGLDRYNSQLQPFNGRDSELDAYEEVLDLAAYMRNGIEEKRMRRSKAQALIGELKSGRTLDAMFVAELFNIAFEATQ